MRECNTGLDCNECAGCETQLSEECVKDQSLVGEITEKREALVESLAVTMETCFIHHDFAWSELSSLAVRTVEQALSDKGEYREKYLMACAMLSEEQKHNYNLQGRICRQRDEITMLHKRLSPSQE